MTVQPLRFTDHGTTQQSGHDGGPRITAASDPNGTGLGQLVAGREPGRMYIAAYAGSQRTGGYGIRVGGVERRTDLIAVRAVISAPSPGALTIQVITSPAQLISIDARAAAGAREAVLFDQNGNERARAPVPESQP